MKDDFLSETDLNKNDWLLDVREVSMRFRMPAEKIDNVKEFVIKAIKGRLKYQEFWVLRDVSFRVRRGESLGILGGNGAGKSTLLKLISGILEPTCGRITVRGKVVPLLKLGAGFDMNATGRENVFLNGALLGFGRKEMLARYEEIVAFAELERFMNMPIKNYSAGMLARLGFSIAVTSTPDLLIVDEVLAVGDASFKKKCAEKISALQKRGTTLLLVSHSPKQVETLCKQAIWIKGGRIVRSGEAREVGEAYAADTNTSHR